MTHYGENIILKSLVDWLTQPTLDVLTNGLSKKKKKKDVLTNGSLIGPEKYY